MPRHLALQLGQARTQRAGARVQRQEVGRVAAFQLLQFLPHLVRACLQARQRGVGAHLRAALALLDRLAHGGDTRRGRGFLLDRGVQGAVQALHACDRVVVVALGQHSGTLAERIEPVAPVGRRLFEPRQLLPRGGELRVGLLRLA